jgi:hypothetical protein
LASPNKKEGTVFNGRQTLTKSNDPEIGCDSYKKMGKNAEFANTKNVSYH